MQTSSAGFFITDYKFDSEKRRFERNILEGKDGLGNLFDILFG